MISSQVVQVMTSLRLTLLEDTVKDLGGASGSEQDVVVVNANASLKCY